MRGRLGSGIMHRLGLPELVASTKQQFVEKAIDLAHDAGKRATASAAIAQRRSILFRDLTPVRALEQHLIEEIMRTRS